jgi:hypothetical protein
MVYSSGSNNKRWGLPAGLTAVLILMIVIMGTAGAPRNAYAAKQGGCGWCHGAYQNISTWSNAGVSTNQFRDKRGVSASPTEGSTLPNNDNDRGLHGIHMNYSSASYKGGGAIQKIVQIGKTGGTKSAFAVAPYGPTTRKVGPTAFGNYSAYVLGRGNCGYCHANSHPNHESGFLEWSSTSVPGNYGQATRGFIRYSSYQGGVSHDLNGNALAGKISSVNQAARYGSCTAACHKGTSMSNPAPWGTYTTAAIKLTCNSCHADSNGATGSEPALSGAHSAHLASSARVTLTNATTMNSASNGSCRNCHTDNTGEGKTTKDWGPTWGTKAYPHASDGTNVVSDNATLTGQITSATKAGKATTCAAACHPRSSEINVAPFNTFMNWSSSMNCNMCHYYEATPTFSNNSAVSTGKLPGAHGLHFKGGLNCDSCHPVPTDTAHVKSLPVSVTGVQYVSGLNYSGGTSGTCQNSCHLSTSGAWSTTTSAQGCATCHNYPGVAGKDWPSSNGHSVRLSNDNLQTYTHLSQSGSYSNTADTYAGVTSDVNKCGLCHGGGTHLSGRVDKNPSSNTAYGYDGVGTFSIVSSATAPTMTCTNVACHSGNPTPNWY